MALATVLLPLYPGAAVLAVVFPWYIILACDSRISPGQQQGEEHAQGLCVHAKLLQMLMQ